jgi:hypothetical protein
MHTKLHLKINGAKGEADRELLRNNLKNLDSLKALHVTSHNGYAEATLEADMQAVSKEEIIEVIKISGDFKVEELVNGEKAGEGAVSANSEAETAPDNSLSKAAFMFGLLGGIGGAALVGSIILGYWLLKSN